MQIRLLLSYVTIYIIILYSNVNDYTDKNYFLLFIPCHFQETEENCEMRCYTVLWKMCMADLSNIQN